MHQRRKNLLFWNIFMSCLLVTVIAIAGLKMMFSSEERYVIASKLYLRTSKDAGSESNAVKVLDFGEKLTLLDEDTRMGDDGLIWARVRDKEGKEGFVAVNYLGSREEVEQLSGIFTDESQARTLVMYKRAVLEYFLDNNYIDNGEPRWRVYGEAAGSEYNYFTEGDFNNDGVQDYACMLSNLNHEVYRLLVYTGTRDGRTDLVHDEEIFDESLLRIMKKGEKISTGRFKYTFEYDADGNLVEVPKKVYEPLTSDALVVKRKDNGKRRLFVFDSTANAFNQPIEMK